MYKYTKKEPETMVDAINGIEPKKIDWYRLTLKEVQEYQSEGMADDMPSEVKRWVEEMAKSANVPDNVTYEMTQSGTAINSTSNEEENSEETTEISSFDQAIALGSQSDLAADEVESLMSEIEDWNERAAAAYNNAESAYSSAMDKINSLMRERENALRSGDNSKAAALGDKITAAGNSSQEVLGGHYNDIAQMQGSVTGFAAIAENAINIGTQTNAIASAELENVGFFKRFRLSNVIAKGTNAINTGNNGLGESLSVQAEIFEFGRNVRSYMSDIEEVSGATVSINTEKDGSQKDVEKTKEDETKDDKNKTVDKTEAEKELKNLSEAEKKENIEEKLQSNIDLTADVLEMIKRKERHGEI